MWYGTNRKWYKQEDSLTTVIHVTIGTAVLQGKPVTTGPPRAGELVPRLGAFPGKQAEALTIL